MTSARPMYFSLLLWTQVQHKKRKFTPTYADASQSNSTKAINTSK